MPFIARAPFTYRDLRPEPSDAVRSPLTPSACAALVPGDGERLYEV